MRTDTVPTIPGMPDASPVLKCVAEADGSVLLLVQGKSGFGKTRVAAAVRELLSGSGVTVHTSVMADVVAGDAVVVDDAHDLPGDHLDKLHMLAGRSDLSVVIFTEPRRYLPDLRELRVLAGKRNGVVDLGELDRVQITELARSRGMTIPAALAASIWASTNGSISLVDCALTGLGAVGSEVITSRSDAETVVQQAIHTRLVDLLGLCDGNLLSTLLLTTLGLPLDPSVVASALSIPLETAEAQVDRARSCGVLSSSDVLLRSAVNPLREVIGVHRSSAIMLGLLDTQLSGSLDTRLAATLAAAGLVDPRLAGVLAARADAAEPHESAALYSAAVLAGMSPDTLAARRSETAALNGDLAAAQGLADRVFEMGSAATDDDLRTAVRVSATIAAEQGMLGRSAELYRWLSNGSGGNRIGSDAPVAAAVLVAAGQLAAAQAVLATAHTGPPTSASASSALLATGIVESVTRPAAIALNSLSRAAALTVQGRPRALPDTAPAVTALLAIHTGDLGRALSVLTRSEAHIRHSALLAWTTMLRGDLPEAQKQLDAVSSVAVNQRDLLFVHALRVGLARRVGDTGSLVQAWNAAQDVLAEYSVDLFSMLPLGELWVAAVRLGEADRVVHLVDQARTLMTELGDPPSWAAAFHWYGVQAAILAESPADLLPHAKKLAVAAETSAYAAGLAMAGRVWLAVLQGHPDAADVELAARRLERIGLSWDGARLASEAALRVSDTKTATTLLQVARSLRPQATAVVTDHVRPTAELNGALSEREAEVAELLILGMTYKEVGARLYISAKTVEHHVSRIRRRVGAGSRSELMSMLRSMGYGAAD